MNTLPYCPPGSTPAVELAAPLITLQQLSQAELPSQGAVSVLSPSGFPHGARDTSVLSEVITQEVTAILGRPWAFKVRFTNKQKNSTKNPPK